MNSYKIIFLFLFLFVLFMEENYCQSGNAQSLELGNRWIYYQAWGLGDTLYTYKEVIRDTLFNNSQYAIVKQKWFGNYGGADSNYSYQRADSNIVYFFNTQDSTENISLNYALNIGDTLNSDPENFSRIIDKTTINMWGKTLRKICVFSTTYGFYGQTNWYIEWIGLISGEGHIPGGYVTRSLLAAKIENNIYGDSTILAIDYNGIIIPTEFKLFQNYPNPFNPTTTIKIVIPKSSSVNLKVYNLLGREVATLIDEEKPPGKYEIEFDGRGLSSGIYFYKLQTDNYSSVKKMILLK